MDQVMQFFAIPIVRALLWLVAALVVATLVRALVVGIVNRTGLKRRLVRDKSSAQEGERSYAMTRDYMGNLAFLIAFLMFVPAIFTTLGVGNAGEPVLQLLDGIWGFLPNVLAASIILAVGLTAARLVRQLLVPVLARVRVDRLQERAGIKVDSKARLSETLSYIAYVAIVVPVVIVALQVLNISAISDPATNMLNIMIGFIPNLIAAAVVIMLGVFVARIAGNLVGQLMATTGIDSRAKSLMSEQMRGTNVSQVVNYAIQAVVIVFFAVEGFSILQLDVFVNIGNAVVAYLPNILGAGLVFAAATFATGVVGRALQGGANARYAPLAQGAIWVLAGIMVLSQLNIAPEIVQAGFVIILGAAGVAFAMAFGLGGQEFAKKTLDDISDDQGTPSEPEPMDLTSIDRAA